MMRVVIRGDKSRYQFLRYLIAEKSMYDEASSEMAVGGSIHMISRRKELGDGWFYSPVIPPYTEVVFPAENGAADFKYRFDDKVLFFDEFPYRTDAELSEQRVALNQHGVWWCGIVLVKNNRKLLESDISTEEMALEEAVTRYKKDKYPVMIYESEKEAKFLFWEHERTVFCTNNEFKRKILQTREKIEEEFEVDYIVSYEIGKNGEASLKDIVNDPSVLWKFTKYDDRLFGRDAGTCYLQKAEDYLWRQQSDCIWGLISKLYAEFMESVLLWDLQRDLKEMKNKIENSFRVYVLIEKKMIFAGNEEEYGYFLNQNLEIVNIFRKKIIDFFEKELPDILKCHMLGRLQTMEEILNEQIS